MIQGRLLSMRSCGAGWHLDNSCRSAHLAGRRAEGQVSLGILVRDPFCQAEAPAATAALVWAHFSLASSLGGTSISLTHRRVAHTRCPLPTARPARTIKVPVPTMTALVISAPALICGPLLRFSLLPMAPSLFRDVITTVVSQIASGIIRTG